MTRKWRCVNHVEGCCEGVPDFKKGIKPKNLDGYSGTKLIDYVPDSSCKNDYTICPKYRSWLDEGKKYLIGISGIKKAKGVEHDTVKNNRQLAFDVHVRKGNKGNRRKL